jgi:diguanylate cyclase (GGDEF)-like protein/PAS domain S-box-containing protein
MKIEMNVLLIETNEEDAKRIQQMLAKAKHIYFHVQRVVKIEDAVRLLVGEKVINEKVVNEKFSNEKAANEKITNKKEARIEIILLDVSLLKDQGIAAYDRLYQAAPTALVLLLGNSGLEKISVQAMRRGAYDYYTKNHIDDYWLPRILRAIARQKLSESAAHAAREALLIEQARVHTTLNSIEDAVITTDLEEKITYLNSTAESMTGWSHEEAFGKPFAEIFKLVNGETHKTVPSILQRVITERRRIKIAPNSLLISRKGVDHAIEDAVVPLQDGHGTVTGIVIVFRFASESRSVTEKMAHLAHHDFLTGLPNRMLLEERLEHAIGMSQRHEKQGALLFLDLDYFKYVNDSLGHSIGDQLLKSVARRLKENVRATDTVSRQGGDEFVILLSEIQYPEDASRAAEKLLAAFADPHIIGKHEIKITLSIGISMFPNDGADAEILIKNADAAMYDAKAQGRNTYRFYKGPHADSIPIRA